MEQVNESKYVPRLFKLKPHQDEWLKDRKERTGIAATATVQALIERAIEEEIQKSKAS